MRLPPFKTWLPKGKPVTLIVGIVCKDAVLLAADGQTTRGTKKSPTEKIHTVDFDNGSVLVAESGIASLATDTISIFRTLAKTRKIEDEYSVKRTAEEAIRMVTERVKLAHSTPTTTPRQAQDLFGSDLNYFELMIASYHGYGNQTQPQLLKLNPLWGTAIPMASHEFFLTSGVGADIADFVLKEHAQPKMEWRFASLIAIKAVKDAIEHVEGCGPPIRVATLTPPHVYQHHLSPLGNPPSVLDWMSFRPLSYILFDKDRIDELSRIVDSVESKTKEARNKIIHRELKRQSEAQFKKMQRDMENLMGKALHKAYSDSSKEKPKIS